MPTPQNDKALIKPKFESIRQIGLGGLIVKGDPQDLQDIESPDMRNVNFDGGNTGPRSGTTLYVAKPVGETGNPSQLIKAKDSNGMTYIIGVFGVNFYLLDTVNVAWVKISPSILPIQSGLFYGSASWNLGTGSDAVYFGNGSDIPMKWIPLLTYLSKAALSSDSQITVPDSTLFPSGTINMTVSIGGTVVTLTNNGTGLTVVITTNPSNSQAWTLTINGTTITGAFVSAIGSTPGNVLIGGTIAATVVNLLGLLQAPGTTNANQVALSAPNQALVNLFTFNSPSTTSITMVPSATVSSLALATNSSTITYNNPNNIITVSGTIGVAIAKGIAITNIIVPVPTIPYGNRFGVTMASGGGYRLFVAGVPSNENILYYSQAYDPTVGGLTQELFTGGSNTLASGFMPIIDGEGGIEEIIDFGQYLGIVKANALVQGYFVIDSTDDTISFNTNPTIYGESIFPVGAHTFPKSAVNIVVENALYIVTVSQGIFQYVPASTGAQLSTTITPFSDNILPLFTNNMLSFAMGRVEYFNRLLMYPCSSIGGTVNNILLIYDFTWKAWMIWDNLNAVDLKEANNNLYFLCNDDGGLYLYDQTSQQDFRSGKALGYTSYLYSKRFDMGLPANPKQFGLAMIQGYITANTNLYVDVLYNEAGSLATSTYIINGNASYVNQVPVFGNGRASLGQNPLGGYQVGSIGFFRIYLDLLYKAGAHIIQLKFYTSNVGDNWALTGIALNPEENEQIPTELKIGSL